MNVTLDLHLCILMINAPEYLELYSPRDLNFVEEPKDLGGKNILPPAIGYLLGIEFWC